MSAFAVLAAVLTTGPAVHAQHPPSSLDLYDLRTPLVGPAELALRRGLRLAAGGAMHEARYAFEEAVRADPTYALAHYNLGVALAALDLRDQAVRAYERAIRHAPRFAEARVNLAIELTRQRRQREALTHLRRAVRDAPRLAIAHHNLAVVLADLGRVAEALAALERAVPLSAHDESLRREVVALRVQLLTAPLKRTRLE